MMNLTAQFGSYYGTVSAAQFHGIVLALVVTFVLALITEAVKFVARRVRGRNDN